MNKTYTVMINIPYTEKLYGIIGRRPSYTDKYGFWDQFDIELSPEELLLIKLSFPDDVYDVFLDRKRILPTTSQDPWPLSIQS